MHSTTLKRSWGGTLSEAQLSKQEAFYGARISHRKLDEVIHAAMPLLTPHNDSSILLIVGATGVGKSTLVNIALKRLYEDRQAMMHANASIIPIVSVEAYANGEQRYSFADVFHDLLIELMEPGLEKKTWIEVTDGKMSVRPGRRITVRAQRRIVESALKFRKTEVVVIDEAYHLLKLAKDTAVLDTLKSLSNKSGVKIVLVGSYDLFDLVETHAQVARRANIIHFDRYQLDLEKDRQTFKSIVRSLALKWPCKEVPNFEAISDELLEVSLGCVGLLKTLLLDASAMQLRNDEKWEGRFLQRAAKSNGLREAIRKEIDAGEAKVRDALYGESLWNDEALARLKQKMG